MNTKVDPMTTLASVLNDLEEDGLTFTAANVQHAITAITALVAAARRARAHVRPTCSELYDELDAALSAFEAQP